MGIRSQVDPAPNGPRLELNGPVAAVPILLQNGFQIGEKEDVYAGVRRQFLLQPEVMGLGAERPLLQKLQDVLLTSEEVSARLEPLHRMHDQVKIVELLAGRLKEVSRKTSRGVVQNRRKLCQCNGCRLIERSGRAAAQDYLLDRVHRLFFFRRALQLNLLACRSGR